MFSCKQSYKYINKLYISKLTALRNSRKTNSNFQRYNLSNIFFLVYKHTCKQKILNKRDNNMKPVFLLYIFQVNMFSVFHV